MNVIPFDPTLHTIGSSPAHIDVDSHFLLLAVYSELLAVRNGEPDRQRAEALHTITRALGAIIERIEPPKGVA